MNIIPHRPPEVWMEGAWDTPADIWAVGCLVSPQVPLRELLLVTGHHLFRWETNDQWGLSKTQNMFYQMMCTTGDFFIGELLRHWPAAVDYFNPNGCAYPSTALRMM
jgi:hypothetical protein